MENKKYILFDLDGTIIEPKEGITKSIAYALDHFNIHIEDLDSLCKYIGPPFREIFMEDYGFSREEVEKVLGKYRERFSKFGVYENELYPGMENLLKNLKYKKLIIATSKPTIFAEKILDYHNVKQYFHFIGGCELNGERSTKGEVIKYVLDYNQISSKDEVVMIGDRKYDVFGAKENDIESIGVLYGYGGFEELSGAGADYLAETVEDLLKMLIKE